MHAQHHVQMYAHTHMHTHVFAQLCHSLALGKSSMLAHVSNGVSALGQGATDKVFTHVAPCACTHMCHKCEKARHDDKFILAKALNMQLNTSMCPNKKMSKAQAICSI